MVEILRYKDFSDSYVKVEAKEDSAIKNAFDISDWKKYIVIVNGIRKDENYIIHKNDVIIIRSIPKENYSVKDWVITIATGGLYALGRTAVESYQARKQMERELEKLKNHTKDDITNVPYIRGAANTIATGKTQPYLIGKHLFTPYIMNGGGNNYKGYHTISGTNGKDSFYNVVLEGGFNKQVLESLSCDDVKVATLFPGNKQPQEGVYPFNANTDFASADSYIEIAQDGNNFSHSEFNQKIVEQEVSDELKKANDENYETLYYTLEKNAKACDVCILFNGLYQMDDSGNKSARSVQVIPEWSPDYAQRLAENNHPENATWHAFNFDQIITTEDSYRNISGLYEESTGWRKSAPSSWTDYLNSAGFKSGSDIRGQDGVTYSGFISQSGSKREGFIFVTYKKKYKISITASKTVFVPGATTHNYSNTFSYNSTTQLRFAAHANFSFTDHFTYDSETQKYIQRAYPIMLRLRCPTNKVTSGQEISQCYVQWIHSYCYDVDKSASQHMLVDERIIGEAEAAKSTLVGVHIKATTVNEDKIKKINIITNGVAPVPTKTDGVWSWNLADKVITSNPASWLIEILTSDTHKASKVSLADEIDAQTFGDLYAYCEEEGFTVNKVLTEGAVKAQVLESILSICHATLYQNIYGKIAVAVDKEKENAIALLNEQNLISFEYEKSVSLEVDGLRCKYIDETSNYQENNFVALYDSGAALTENSVLREVSLDGITNEIQARRQARYIMANEKLRPLKANARIGNEGYFFTPLSKILVQHPSLKIGLGNAVVRNIIIKGDKIIGIDLYDPIEIDLSNPFTVIIQCVGDDYCTPISRTMQYISEQDLILSNDEPLELSDGTNLRIFARPSAEDINEPVLLRENTFYFSTPISIDSPVIPHQGDVVSYGYELETVSREFTITAIKPNGTEGYSLELLDYNKNVFDFDSAEIPDYEALITERRPLMGEVPKEVPEVYTTIEKANEIASLAAQSVSEETATRVVADKTPKYLGKLSVLPSSANEGDWFTANGISGRETGKVYKYKKVLDSYEWQELSATTENYKELMAALPDILSLRSASDAYFGSVFAQTLVANEAFLDSLASSVITLYQKGSSGGIIKSANFSEEDNTGWKIGYDGDAYFANGVFRGEVEATSGSFSGSINATSGVLKNLRIDGVLLGQGQITCLIGDRGRFEPNTLITFESGPLGTAFDCWMRVLLWSDDGTYYLEALLTCPPMLGNFTQKYILFVNNGNRITVGDYEKGVGSHPFIHTWNLKSFKANTYLNYWIIYGK